LGSVAVSKTSDDPFSYLGRISIPNFQGDIYSYSGLYDDNGTMKYLLDPDSIILIALHGFNLLFGAIHDLDASYDVKYFSKSWTENDPSVRWILVKSAPLPVSHIPYTWVCAKVL
jgi:hypothetical protein